MSVIHVILRKLYEQNSFSILQLVCMDIGIKPAKSVEETIERICKALNTDVNALVSNRTVSVGVEGWNSLLCDLGLPPRKSYDNIRKELIAWAAPFASGPGSPKREVAHPIDFRSIPEGVALKDGFTIKRQLGEGGFGAAYLATKQYPTGTFVVKVADRRPDFQASLQNEFNVANTLSHPGVCRVFRIEDDPRVGKFLVLEYGGESFDQITKKPWSLANVVIALKPIAAALDYLHQRNVVHGDINPGNLLLDTHRQARLTDFGLSAFLRERPDNYRFTRVAQSIVGYHRYFSAPEVIHSGIATSRSDQTSLARVCLWMLAGGEPFYKDAFVGLRKQQIPVNAGAALERAMSPSPQNRFDNCRTFVSQL